MQRHVHRVTKKEFADKFRSLLRQHIWFSVYETPREKVWTAIEEGERLTLALWTGEDFNTFSLRRGEDSEEYIAVH